MSQAFTLAPPPHSAPRRRASRPQMEATVQFTRSGSSSKTTFQSSVEAAPAPVSVPVSVMTSTPEATQEVVAGRSRSASRSFKRFKSPFSRSTPSSPERSATAASAAPEFPAQLSDKVAALKASEESTSKASKKSKAKSAEKKKADDRVHYHANSSNQRPMNYATNVQLEMLMGGGSQDYWLSKSRKTGNSGEDGEEEEEVGGFKDEDGNIWWDVEEKAEWTSLLPKDGQGLPATTYDMWVDFNTDYRRSSTSSADSTISSFSAELMEEMDGPVLYGDVEAEQAHNTLYGMQKATGTVLFPIAMGDESAADASAARAIMSQAKQTLSGKSAVVISNEFEDSFLSYEASNASSTVRVVNVVPTKEISVVAVPAAKSKKSGLLKGLWGSKSSSSRQ